jgi:hypothetical protein
VSGHLFIVHGDLTQLSCDAWLLPCDVRIWPSRGWRQALAELVPDANLVPSPRWAQPTMEWYLEEQRAMKVTAWPDALSRPWVGNVGAAPETAIGWFVAGADDFIRRAADDLRGTAPRHDREKHLLALPVIGTGFGGARRRAGDVVRELIPVLRRRAEEGDLDIALVTNDPLTFAAAEAQRGTARAAFPALGDALWAATERLAESARDGELVLFLGAGVSTGSGLPRCSRLIADLARAAGMTDQEIEQLVRNEVVPSSFLRDATALENSPKSKVVVAPCVFTASSPSPLLV